MREVTINRIKRALVKVDQAKENYAFAVKACILDRVGTDPAFRKTDFLDDLQDLNHYFNQYNKACDELYRVITK